MAKKTELDIVLRVKDAFSKGIKDMQNSLKSLGDTAKRGSNEINNSFKNSGGFKNASKNIKQADKELNKLAGTAKKASNSITKSSKKAGNSIRTNLTARITAAGKSFKGFAEAAKKNMAAVGVSITAVTFAVSDGIKKFADFEKSMKFVNTIARKSGKDFDMMSDAVENMSKQYGISATEVSRALFDIYSNVGETGKNLEILEASAKASIGGFADIGTTAAFVTKAVNTTNLTAEDSIKIFDILFKGLDKGSGTMQQWGRAVSEFLPSGTALNISLEEQVAIFAELSKASKSAEIGATQTRAFFDALADPRLKGVLKDIPELGEAWSAFNSETGELREVPDIIGDIVKATENITDERKFEIIKKLFPNEEAIKAARTLVNNYEQALNTINNVSKNFAGKTEENFREMSDTTSFRIAQMEQEWNAAMRSMGDSTKTILLPALKGLSNQLETMSYQWGIVQALAKDGVQGAKDFAYEVKNQSAGATEELTTKIKELYAAIEQAQSTVGVENIKTKMADAKKTTEDWIDEFQKIEPTSDNLATRLEYARTILQGMAADFKDIEARGATIGETVQLFTPGVGVSGIQKNKEKQRQELIDLFEDLFKDLSAEVEIEITPEVDVNKDPGINEVKKSVEEIIKEAKAYVESQTASFEIKFLKAREAGADANKLLKLEKDFIDNIVATLRNKYPQAVDLINGLWERQLNLTDQLKGNINEISQIEQLRFNAEEKIVRGRIEGVKALQLERQAEVEALKFAKDRQEEVDILNRIWQLDKQITSEVERQNQEYQRTAQQQREAFEVVERGNEEAARAEEERAAAKKQAIEDMKRRQQEAHNQTIQQQRDQIDDFRQGKELELKQFELGMGMNKDELALAEKRKVVIDDEIRMLQNKHRLYGNEVVTLNDIKDLELQRLDIQMNINELRDKGLTQLKEDLAESMKRLRVEQEINKIVGDETDTLDSRISALKNYLVELKLSGQEMSKAFVEARRELKQLDAERDYQKAADEAAEAAKQAGQEMHDTLSSAIKTGMTEGASAGAEAFRNTLMNKFYDKIADDFATAILKGHQFASEGITMSERSGGSDSMTGSLGGLFDIFGGLGGGTTGGSNKPSDGAGGFFGSIVAPSGESGGMLGGLFGGLGGGLGAAMPWIAGISLISGLFGKKGPAPQFSGVQPIGGGGVTQVGGDFGSLFGSDVFERASFSARNANNDVTREFAGARMGGATTVEVEFRGDAADVLQVKSVKKSNSNSRRGVPIRTGFNSG